VDSCHRLGNYAVAWPQQIVPCRIPAARGREQSPAILVVVSWFHILPRPFFIIPYNQKHLQ
jgi:hypothetical protein